MFILLLRRIVLYSILTLTLTTNSIAGNNSSVTSAHMISFCHVPPGNPDNALDITTDIAGFHGHQNHPYDHMGKCNGTNTSSEDLFIVYDCKDDPNIANNDYRTEFLTKLFAYNTPVVITQPLKVSSANIDTNAADFSVVNYEWTQVTEAALEVLSNCMDQSKGNAKVDETSDKEVSVVMNCKSLAVNEAYKYALTTEINNNFSFNHAVVPDQARTDSTVNTEYTDCLNEDSDYLIFRQETEDGNNFSIVSGCSNITALQNAIQAYQDGIIANSDYPVVLPASSLEDYEVAAAYDECCDASKGGATCVKQYGSGFAGRQNMRELY